MAITHTNHLTTDLFAFPGAIPVSHLYTAGIAHEPFLQALKKGRLVGSRSSDGTIHFPPRLYDERTLERLEDFVDLEGTPTLYSYTVARIDVDGEPLEEPQVMGAASWGDGVRGVLVHRILAADAEALEIGMALRVRWRPEGERTATIMDIEGFEPA